MAVRNDKPNIVTILADQYRYDALSFRGNPVVKTPNLDKLASGGAFFSNAICTSPLCGPSRASLLTGMYPSGHGFHRNAEVFEDGMSEKLETIDEILKCNGYSTHYFGKWHTGCTHRDCYVGGLPYYLDYYKEYLDSKYPFTGLKSGQKVDRYTGREYDADPIDDMMAGSKERGIFMPHHNEAGRSVAGAQDSLTAWTAGLMLDFLSSRHKENTPFAATCSFLHPHAPLIACEPYFSMYPPASIPIPDNILDDVSYSVANAVPDTLAPDERGLLKYCSIYYGLVTEIDFWIGRILGMIESAGFGENTLVIFTSDHGELMGSHRTLSKMKMFEESLRVPFIVNMPDAIPSGSRIDAAVSGADVAPTILDFAGLAVPAKMHGRSLKPALTGKNDSDEEYAVSILEGECCLRSYKWKLILNPLSQHGIRNKYLLYDLESDPGEKTNLLPGKQPDEKSLDMANSLRKILLKKLTGIGVGGEQLSSYARLDFDGSARGRNQT